MLKQIVFMRGNSFEADKYLNSFAEMVACLRSTNSLSQSHLKHPSLKGMLLNRAARGANQKRGSSFFVSNIDDYNKYCVMSDKICCLYS